MSSYGIVFGCFSTDLFMLTLKMSWILFLAKNYSEILLKIENRPKTKSMEAEKLQNC